MTIAPGTVVSTGTLNEEHLIERYIDFLRRARGPLGPAAHYAEQWERLAPELRADPGHAGLLDESHFLADDLAEELERIAPDGCYFGALEGNTSEFGFWPIPPEDESDDHDGPFDDFLDGRGEP